MGSLGRAILSVYSNWRRVRDGAFSRLARGGFAQFGERSHLSLPIELRRPDRIHIGSGVYFGPGCWLQAVAAEDQEDAHLEIGDRCSFAGFDVVSAAKRIVIEPGVLFARNVYVSDHAHAFDDLSRPIQDQGVDKVEEVIIETGAWLGQNVVVCPGVRIGCGSVIGAGSVVNRDVPAHSIAVGAPAKVIKQAARV